jgi:hypothetical protein
LERLVELGDQNEEMLLHFDYHGLIEEKTDLSDQNEEMILMMVIFADQNGETLLMMVIFLDRNEEMIPMMMKFLDRILKMSSNDDHNHFLHHFHYCYWKNLHYRALFPIEEDDLIVDLE